MPEYVINGKKYNVVREFANAGPSVQESIIDFLVSEMIDEDNKEKEEEDDAMSNV